MITYKGMHSQIDLSSQFVCTILRYGQTYFHILGSILYLVSLGIPYHMLHLYSKNFK